MSKVLGHVVSAGTVAVNGIYDRYDRLPEMRAALTAWSAHMSRLVSGRGLDAEVVPFVRT